MKARDILKDFYSTAFDFGPQEDFREGVYSDVYGTLVKHDTLNRPYYDFLVWIADQEIPVTLMSSEPKRAQRELRALGVREDLIESMTDKMEIADSADKAQFEAVIDDQVMFLQTGIYINPNSSVFKKFLSTSQYRNHGRSHQEDPPRPRVQ